MIQRQNMHGEAPITFLFNHDAGHQAAHLAGIAGALALQQKGRKVVVAFGSDATRTEVEKLLSQGQIAALDWYPLALPKTLEWLTRGLNKLVPIHRLLRLYYHNAQLRRAVRINGADCRCVCGAVPVRYTGCNDIPRFGKTRVKVVIKGWQGNLMGH
ncbi:MAG: hypothetical protein B7Y00_07935 [Sphingomonadales bacterium 17-56-6]|nr:MAG: hypothetical protein B7Y00_07935 [Sphingomonadales bacterium 17-56-6]